MSRENCKKCGSKFCPQYLCLLDKSPAPSLITISSDTASVTIGAAKNDQDKPDLSLIPKEALEAAAQAFMVGEKKYGRYNYYKGHSASKLIAALIRHATAWMDGEENDPKDGQPHLGSVIACAAMLLKQKALGTLKDDRYKADS